MLVNRRKMKRFIRVIAVIEMVCQLFYPVVTHAAATIPGFYGATGVNLQPPSVTALPKLNTVVQNATVSNPVGNTLTIQQTGQNAIIDWNSFDIGSSATVIFNQKGNTSWSALNCILDQNPSQIYGTLTSTGSIYLINQNGILFGPGSQINVHSLIASSLNITDDDFLANNLHFKGSDASGVVSNQGTIKTDATGTVFLFGSEVENNGTITAPYGQIVLAAGNEFTIDTSNAADMPLIDYNPGQNRGITTNFEDGSIIADYGIARLYGRVVNQDGLVRSVSALKQSGKIELLASDEVITGPESQTISPIDTSDETATADSGFNPSGTITIAGLGGIGTAVENIWHQGVISAPHGVINLSASERVLLDAGSTIDASGMWVDEPAGANLIDAQLNSIQLRDDENQKTGTLLGQLVSFNKTTGTSIGDTSGNLTTTEVNALELSTTGGTISINSLNGDIIAKQGANISFSGGGYRYSPGAFETTKLVSGNTVYDISNAPENITYDNILGNDEEVYSKFGITKTFEGIYYGGSSPIKDYSSGFIQGSDAGSLTLDASRIAFEGKMDGSAFSGVYQVNTSNPLNTSGLIKALGVQEAGGGTLYLGAQQTNIVTSSNVLTSDCHLGDVVISSDFSELPTDFGIDSPYPGNRNGTSYLSPDMLNNASLDNVYLNSNASVTIAKGADVELQAGGTIDITARQIENHGEITIPSGSVNLTLQENSTYPQYLQDGITPNPAYLDINQQIYVDGTIDVSGQKVDNSQNSQPLNATDHTGGGNVILEDETPDGNGVLIANGGKVDVSGGYAISQNGTIMGADAGTLTIQGSSIVLNGDIRGYSLAGNNGGALDLRTSKNIYVSNAGSPLPDTINTANTFVLADNRLDDTGFTQITLSSVNDITIGTGAMLSPSSVKEMNPVPKGGNAQVDDYSSMEAAAPQDLKEKGLFTVDSDYLGKSAITLQGGISKGPGGEYSCYGDEPVSIFTANLNLSAGSAIEAAPKGTVTLQAPGIDIAGDITAPGGTISATATTTQGGGLNILSGSTISAAGYNEPNLQAPANGLSTNLTPVNGGEVDLTSQAGDLIIKKGAVIDVSGSQPTPYTLSNTDGTIYSQYIASEPGTVSLSFYGTLNNNGVLDAKANLAGLEGGTLTISKTNLDTDAVGLNVTSGDIESYLASGFDALTFQSKTSIDFEGSMDKNIGRSLTLDAPLISSQTDGQTISLSAPNITLTNSYYPSQVTDVATGSSLLALSGDWINVQGSVMMQGFKNVSLVANHDIMLTDTEYTNPKSTVVTYAGLLQVPGDLTLGADRIYPTTMTDDFIIQATNGTVTTKPGQGTTEGPILSAGGSLTIDAENIDHTGALYAPMGTISLISEGRTYLETNSIISTKGQAGVYYGELGDTEWTIPDKSNPTGTALQVSEAPTSSIEITGGQEVIVKQGAKVDASGGGSIFSYEFVPGTSGSTDPLTKSGLYIIVPGLSMPGEAVTINGSGGLAAGTYTLLSAQNYGYLAFMPGAYVLSYQGVDTSFGRSTVSSDGYPLVYGYTTLPGTNIKSVLENVYSVIPASDILTEAGYSTKEFVAGNAGTISIAAPTTIFNGEIAAQALDRSYQGGTISISAADIEVTKAAVALPEDFTFAEPVPEDLEGKCVISAEGLNNTGVSELNLGQLLFDSQGNPLPGTTKTIDLKEGVALTATMVTLNAADSITLESGVDIEATGTGGTAKLITDITDTTKGNIVLNEGSVVHATEAVDITANNLENNGKISADNGTLNLSSTRIVMTPDGYQGAKTDGLYLTDTLNGFEGFDNVGLSGTQGLVFKGDINFNVTKELDIDVPMIEHEHEGTDVNTVSVQSGTLSIMNSGSSYTDTSQTDIATLKMSADQMSFGHGDLTLEGFGSVDIQSKNDLTIKGNGSLTIDGSNGLVPGAAVNVEAARITTTYYMDETVSGNGTNGTVQDTYEVPDFTIDAGSRALAIESSGSTPGATETPGGTLAITAGSIDNAGIIDVPAGTVKLTATTGDLTLENGSQILAKGTKQTTAFGTTVSSDGGTVELTTNAGGFTGKAGSIIDVSAAENGDAGMIAISAPNGRVVLDSVISGQALGGQGGSFKLDAGSMNGSGSDVDLGTLAASLSQGGFSESISLRDHTDNLHLGDGENSETLQASNVELTADAGTITIGKNGTIDAAGSTGGAVEINAGSDLNLSGTIDANATGTGQNGGEVMLSSDHGQIRFAQGGFVDVSAGPASSDTTGTGGSVYFRAQRTGTGAGTDMAMDLEGAVQGASLVAAEAFKKYSETTITATDQSISGTLYTDTLSFMSNYQTLYSHLESMNYGTAGLLVLPGIEVDSASDLTLATTPSGAWDVTQWRFPDQSGNLTAPGMLTLRAAGNLILNNNLVDHPTSMNALQKSSMQDSWGITLVAGADLNSADAMAVNTGNGTLTIGEYKIGKVYYGYTVYTEGAPLRFASGGDTVIKAGAAAQNYMGNYNMGYNIATFDGSIKGEVGGDLDLSNGGIIQSAAGDIDITVAGDLALGLLGAVRTTGYNINSNDQKYNPNYTSMYWDYGDGGNITLDVGGDVSGQINPNAWDTEITNANEINDNGTKSSFTPWLANYSDSLTSNKRSTRGIATMGGGDLTIHTGGDFAAQAGTFGLDGTSDLKIVSGGDINGRFLVKYGLCELTAMGNFGTYHNQVIGQNQQNQIIEAFDTDVRLTAQGDIELGTVANPTAADPNLPAKTPSLTYTPDSSVHLTSLTGDVTITGIASPYGNISSPATDFFPGTLEIAAGRDINLAAPEIILAPSPSGNLTLMAGRDISGSYVDNGIIQNSIITMSDTNYNSTESSFANYVSDVAGQNSAHDLIHSADTTPIDIQADSDIHDLALYLPKKALIGAGNDIYDMYVSGQNLNDADVSCIWAGNDIVLSTPNDPSQAGILYNGPGTLIVQAGNSLDLGTSLGIQSLANQTYPNLSSQGCNLIVAAGIERNLNPTAEGVAEVGQFFTQIKNAGVEYTNKLANDPQGALDVVSQARTDVIEPFVGTTDNSAENNGDINMISSQITSAQGGDISIIAGGSINVGRSALPSSESSSNTGITTQYGGNINIFAENDVNVLESRVMTLHGGDILVWSDNGDINAGRGSTTAVSAGAPKSISTYLGTDSNGNPVYGYSFIYPPTAVGSGIRTVTYASDELHPAPEPGNAYIFAPSGIIDAGEAGIAANNLYIGALKVLNTQNIQVTGVSVGVPITNTNTGSLTALSGTSNLNQASQLTEEMSGLSSSSAKSSAAAEESYVPQWVKVMVIGFGDDEQGQDNSGQGDDDQAKKKAKKQNQDK
jgi:filamentous hemagglutinin family protein